MLEDAAVRKVAEAIEQVTTITDIHREVQDLHPHSDVAQYIEPTTAGLHLDETLTPTYLAIK